MRFRSSRDDSFKSWLPHVVVAYEEFLQPLMRSRLELRSKRVDGDALLSVHVEKPKLEPIREETGTFSRGVSNFVKNLASPTGFEPAHA